MSAYIRKIAIDGYVIRLDLSDLKEVSRLMGIEGPEPLKVLQIGGLRDPHPQKAPKKPTGIYIKTSCYVTLRFDIFI